MASKRYKTCSDCGRKLLAMIKNFSRSKRGKYGLRSQCKYCQSLYRKRYYLRHRVTELTRSKAYNRKYYNTIRGYLNRIYYGMKNRCNNPKAGGYKYYGGRGIKCKFASANEFIDYVINELKVDPRNLQTDRVDNDGNYEKGNIRFVTPKENCANRR